MSKIAQFIQLTSFYLRQYQCRRPPVTGIPNVKKDAYIRVLGYTYNGRKRASVTTGKFDKRARRLGDKVRVCALHSTCGIPQSSATPFISSHRPYNLSIPRLSSFPSPPQLNASQSSPCPSRSSTAMTLPDPRSCSHINPFQIRHRLEPRQRQRSGPWQGPQDDQGRWHRRLRVQHRR